MEQEIYRVNDFCQRYAISRSGFYREIRAKRLHILKRGCRTYVARSDAETWLEKQRLELGPEKDKLSQAEYQCSKDIARLS